MIGRAYIYGLGAAGEAGVTHALNILQKELSVTMGLAGVRDVKDISREHLLLPTLAFTIPAPAQKARKK
jgi:L-lactate dehydrogenase (cytochrome)